VVALNAAKNYPCMFMLFVKPNKEQLLENFIKVPNVFCIHQQAVAICVMAGKFFHEVLQMAVNYTDPIENLLDPLMSLMTHPSLEVQVSCLPKLGSILNIINKYFKHKVLQAHKIDMEKFSLKDLSQVAEIELSVLKLNHLTLVLLKLEETIVSNPVKHWRQINEYYY